MIYRTQEELEAAFPHEHDDDNAGIWKHSDGFEG